MDRIRTRRFARRDFLKPSLVATAGTALIDDRLNAARALAGPATPVAGGDPDRLFAELEELVVNRMAELKVPVSRSG